MRILIADDHTIAREGLKAVLHSFYPNAIILAAKDGKKTLEILQAETIELTILDISMPFFSGLEILKWIQENQKELPTILLTMHHEESYFDTALDNGALGYILKEDASSEIAECIQSVLKGELYVSRNFAHFSISRKQAEANIPAVQKQLESLSNAELNTLKLVAENKSSKEIAEMLFVAPKSVENYRSRICKKLALSGKNNSLLHWALENKKLVANFKSS